MKILILFLLTFNAYALDCKSPSLDSLAVQERGRVKPYLVMANEALKLITGESKLNGMSSSETFCLWTKNSLGIEPTFTTPVKVEHIKVKELLGMGINEISIDSKALILKKELLRSAIMKEEKSTAYKKELEKVLTRIMTLEAIESGSTWTTPKIINGEAIWHSFKDLYKVDDETILPSLLENEKNYSEVTKDTHGIELFYTKTHPFSYSMLISLIAIILVVLRKDLGLGRNIAILSILLQTFGMVLRVMISGRAPITNMYETVMFSGYGALLISIIITYFKRERLFLIGGLSYNILCLFMMMFASSMLDSTISPLVPVLRDNFWLSTHVSTIILSYAALALTWMLANIVLYKVRFETITRKDYKYYEDLIYTCMKVGVILLAAGIILGGVWADYSWGRFWGWDPKETWSLIVLLFYMAILHGKTTNWMNPHRFIVLSAAGFMSVMMAWFGVNYILATGLHSYGFSEGGAVFLGSFFAIQTAFIIITGYKPRVQNIKNPT